MATYSDYKNFIKHVKGKDVPNIDIIIFRLKNHIERYPDDKITLSIKDWLYDNIKNQFLNPKLENAFEMNDELPYSKNIEIYHNLPFIKNYHKFKYWFYNLLTVYTEYDGNVKSFYLDCKNFCRNYKEKEIPEYIFSRVNRFCDDNKLLMSMAFDSEGRKNKNKSDKVDVIGPTGEKYIFNELSKTNGKPIYLQNDAFGFDVLYYQKKKEFLIEVKTTDKKLMDDYYFHITKHERKILEHTLTLPNTEYIIERVFLNKNDNSISHITLMYDKETDSFYNNDNPEYEICYKTNGSDKLKFYVNIKKKNILKLKNSNH